MREPGGKRPVGGYGLPKSAEIQIDQTPPATNDGQVFPVSDLVLQDDGKLAPARTRPHRAERTVSAVIVSYWTGLVLQDCLEALLHQPEISEVIVVDNGNDRATLDWLHLYAQQHPRIMLIEPGHNLGFSVGCNLGVSHASGNFIALINPDVVLDPGTIAAFLEVFRVQRSVWLCGGRLQHPDGTEQRGGRREILSPWRAFVELSRLDRVFGKHPYFQRLHLHEGAEVRETCDVPTVSGAFMMIPRRLYQRLGGMDDNIFMHFEDADLCIRIRQHRGRVLYCGHIPVCHHLSTSDASRLFIEWHKTRSTSYYFFKHFSVSYPYWSLLLVSSLLWLRLLVKTAPLLLRDIPGIIRRWQRRG